MRSLCVSWQHDVVELATGKINSIDRLARCHLRACVCAYQSTDLVFLHMYAVAVLVVLVVVVVAEAVVALVVDRRI